MQWHTRGLVAGAIGAGAYALALQMRLIPHVLVTFNALLVAVSPFIIAWACWGAARRHEGRTRRGWLWIMWTLLASAAYDIVWMLQLELHRAASPAFTLAFLALIPMGMVGVLNLAVLRDRSSTLRRTFDGIFISASVFLVSWCLVLRMLYLGSTGSVAARIAVLSYPFSDGLILSLVILLATGYRSDRTTPLTGIAVALAIWSISDSVFAYLSFKGAYYAGHPVEVGWLFGFAVLFFAARHARPVDSEDAEQEKLPRVELPIITGAIAFAVGVTVQLVRHRVDPVVLYTLIALAILALARQFLAVVEHQRFTIARLRALDETKTNILRAVSHELRTPLTFIKGTSTFLGEQWRDLPTTTVNDLFSRVNSNCERLDGLLGSLLDLDRLSRGVIEPTRRPTDVRSLIERVVESVPDEAHTISVTGDHIRAEVDASQIERVVENLLINAVRHTPAGTSIEANCARGDDGVVITVSDDGPGVPAELRPTIFDPFVQSESSIDAGRGTGIGLSLVAKFTELHGGHVSVDESDAGGAAFRVYLPDAA